MTRNQKGDAKPDPNMKTIVWGLTWKVVHSPGDKTAGLSKGSFGKGGAGNSIWADPSTKTIYIVMQNISGGDNTLGMQAVLKTAAKALPPK
jgi:CubicO group peptidase (beta-lactamase class C family)